MFDVIQAVRINITVIWDKNSLVFRNKKKVSQELASFKMPPPKKQLMWFFGICIFLWRIYTYL